MDSNIHHHSYQLQQQQNQPGSGLLRFRSAPSSLLANFTAESEGLISRFVSYGDNSNDTASPGFQELEDKPSKAPNLNESALNRMNSQQGYSINGLPPHYPRHNGSTTTSNSSAMDSSYGLMRPISMGMDQEVQRKGFTSQLLRQSSSPAGLLSDNIAFQNGYATMKGVGNYGGVNGSNGEPSTSINRLKNQISFSSGNASSLGMLSQISEIESEGIGATSPDDGRQGGTNGPGFPYSSWNDTQQLSENLSGLKRGPHNAQNGELGNQVHMLSHHLSLPKASAEMVAMEKLLQFPDSVPCKIRAKRGCATHPRSIAERVRRTRISERMRKLQELVPNMEKQTNTADMLDLAVEYIKDLQKQFKTLSQKRANCKCLGLQKTDTNQIA